MASGDCERYSIADHRRTLADTICPKHEVEVNELPNGKADYSYALTVHDDGGHHEPRSVLIQTDRTRQPAILFSLPNIQCCLNGLVSDDFDLIDAHRVYRCRLERSPFGELDKWLGEHLELVETNRAI